jgi:hypothetical protein
MGNSGERKGFETLGEAACRLLRLLNERTQKLGALPDPGLQAGSPVSPEIVRLRGCNDNCGRGGFQSGVFSVKANRQRSAPITTGEIGGQTDRAEGAPRVFR